MFARPAIAEQSQAFVWCEGRDTQAISPDLQISGCTTVIDSGTGARGNLAAAFYNRGNAYSAQKDYDHAIQDYDQAIRLKPNFAQAFNNRGSAYHIKGDTDRAIRD